MDTTKNRQAEFVAAVKCNTTGLTAISTGLCPTCPECQRDHGMGPREFYSAYEGGKVCEEPCFSCVSCECCGSQLAGDRYSAHAIEATGELNHLEVCVDCVLFLANGDLPESW